MSDDKYSQVCAERDAWINMAYQLAEWIDSGPCRCDLQKCKCGHRDILSRYRWLLHQYVGKQINHKRNARGRGMSAIWHDETRGTK